MSLLLIQVILLLELVGNELLLDVSWIYDSPNSEGVLLTLDLGWLEVCSCSVSGMP